MKSIWGGSFNWNKRSVLVKYNGRTIAASAAGMLHAGNEGAPGGEWTSWRSDDYGESWILISGENQHHTPIQIVQRNPWIVNKNIA